VVDDNKTSGSAKSTDVGIFELEGKYHFLKEDLYSIWSVG
jgi:hypothetical protein